MTGWQQTLVSAANVMVFSLALEFTFEKLIAPRVSRRAGAVVSSVIGVLTLLVPWCIGVAVGWFSPATLLAALVGSLLALMFIVPIRLSRARGSRASGRRAPRSRRDSRR